MQTFLPLENLEETASILDSKRLGKQRVETMMIMQILARQRTSWSHHPASKMWVGYGWALLQYQFAICNEWVTNRHYVDHCLDRTIQLYDILSSNEQKKGIWPWWMGIEDFHLSHRSNLVRKKPEYYRQFWPNVPADLKYYWPTYYL